MLRILSIAYALGVVGPDAGGGSEQVLSMLDAAIVEAGHRSFVVAREGSKVAGELVGVACRDGPLDARSIEEQQQRHAEVVARAVAELRIDVVHAHGLDFHRVLPATGVAALATLHCPPEWYPEQALRNPRPHTFLNAVSAHQHARLAGIPNLLPPVENGVPVAAFAGAWPRGDDLLVLGRIAPEKGIHLAIDAARAAGARLVIAGGLDDYPDHKRYFETSVAPRLGDDVRLVGPVGFEEKRRLLGEARALLVCPEVEETSSLVAREAMASGTPVIALRRGALVDAVEHGVTGFLVDEPNDLPAAIARAAEIDAEQCRRRARERFDARDMARAYLRIYERLAAIGRADAT